jgi:iron complex transport system substrate-binding protein
MIGKNQLGIEQIILWNPQVILANEPGAALLIASSSKWSEIEGVKNRKVFQMPIGISRWGHPGSLETPLATLWTAKTLYPEFFGDIDIQKELRYFYKTFFNYDLSEKLVRHVLSGRGMRLTKNKKKVQ